ncbi:hypothetical protein ACW7G0_10390 [Lysobacter sp. A286]
MSEGRQVGSEQARAGRWLAIVATVVVVLTVGAAITLMRSPSAQREVTLDNKRVQDLQQIVQLVDLYARQHDALPPDIATLASLPGQQVPLDPVDGTAYDYQVTGERGYRLCANFSTDTARTAAGQPRSGVEWNHAAGRHCFDRKHEPAADSGQGPPAQRAAIG